MSHDVYQLSPHPKNQKSTLKVPRVKVSLWIKPAVKAELERIAKMHGLTLSKTGAAGLEAWVNEHVRSQQEALLYPLIRQVIREELRSFGNRIVFFLMRIAFAAEQSRILITNVLDRVLRLLKVPEQTFTTLVDQSNRMARRNIIQKTPQIKSLLEEWEAAYKDIREEDTSKNNG